jgi:hypothetical protein
MDRSSVKIMSKLMPMPSEDDSEEKDDDMQVSSLSIWKNTYSNHIIFPPATIVRSKSFNEILIPLSKAS